ncbi:MAG: DUF4062 domain-containing protein, partial [Deltaproteobacteria bacterium]|nr:DUF4062 domain-containing protein [Deltaproteobacteria bacterium]
MTTTSSSPAFAEGGGSRTVRVFISSTFRDFGEERDLLVRRVFPELRRRAREREVEVVDVDLRWGITEAEAERGETLSICLQEIDRCRPFFVGLLGERYGWQPDADRYPASLLERQPWLRQHQGGTSVTELEILHGVIEDPGMSGLAFFYLRDPSWSAARGADYASESADAKARLARLKERIRGSGFPVFEGYASPQAVAARILEDLWSRIDARFPASEVPDEHEQERRRHEAFAQTRRTLYVGCESAVSGLLAHLDGASEEAVDGVVRCSRIVVVTGESGCGKSALLANAMSRLRASRPKDLVFEHYLGSASDAGNADAIARRLCREVIRRERVSRGEDPNKAGDKAVDESGMAGGGSGLGRQGRGEMGGGLGSGLGGADESGDQKTPRDADGLAVDSDKLFEELPEYLARGAALARQQGGRFVVVLDALDKLSSKIDASWLPKRVPPNMRLVLSTLEGPALATARDRAWPIETASRLTASSARQLVVESLERFNKRLPEGMLDAIASHGLATLPIFLRVLTDELRVFGSHEELPARLSGYLACGSVESLHEQVLARVEGDLEREGGRVEDLAGVLTALWASRRGLSEA